MVVNVWNTLEEEILKLCLRSLILIAENKKLCRVERCTSSSAGVNAHAQTAVTTVTGYRYCTSTR